MNTFSNALLGDQYDDIEFYAYNGSDNEKNVRALSTLFNYLEQIISNRIISTINKMPGADLEDTPFPSLPETARLSVFINQYHLGRNEIILLLLALCPHVMPGFMERVIMESLTGPGDFPQLGGSRGKDSRGFLPTGETAIFLLAGDDMQKRLQFQKIFDSDHLFSKLNLLTLDEVAAGEPRLGGKLVLNREYIELFTTGHISYPKMSLDFPAQHMTTEMDWDDVVLRDSTLQQILELQHWVKHHDTLMRDWGMQKKLKPGYRTLFYGPPGTGKTLTATLLGKYTGREVFKIDLSMVVSKFIGETEKNLSQLFNRAENKNWILFFDEADALFSKRTNVRDAHDKYANQEAAFLLQRVETFDGLVILATNYKNNIDEAFIRRFHAIINFPQPSATERLMIWQKGFPSRVTLSKETDLTQIAKRYELNGASIMNVIQYACLEALVQSTTCIDEEMILSGIRREYQKEGKIW